MLARRLLASLTLTLAAIAAGAADAPQPPAGGVLGVEVGGHQLLRDCKPWVPRGLSLFGRLVPAGRHTDPSTAAARDHYDAQALPLARAFDADVIRLQIGLPFLDPQSPQRDDGYLAELKQAVAAARRAGLSVILSLQWEGRTAVKPVETTPKAAALRTWAAVAPAFAGDLGIAFELFNEPSGPPEPGRTAWQTWHDGHQAIIDALRQAGVRNLLIVDGLRKGHWLAGSPPLADPLGQLAYAVHPYFGEEDNSPAGWDARFGQFAASHPVLVSEWSHLPRHCERGGGERVQQFLDYLAARHIGLVAYGADEQHNRLLHEGPGRPQWTHFEGQACTGDLAGPGEQVHDWFQHQAAAAAHAAPVAPAACARPAGR